MDDGAIIAQVASTACDLHKETWAPQDFPTFLSLRFSASLMWVCVERKPKVSKKALVKS